jgi:hypothetical protein
MAANDDLSETSLIKYIQINVREHGRDNKKGQSRENGNIGDTRHRTKTNNN